MVVVLEATTRCRCCPPKRNFFAFFKQVSILFHFWFVTWIYTRKENIKRQKKSHKFWSASKSRVRTFVFNKHKPKIEILNIWKRIVWTKIKTCFDGWLENEQCRIHDNPESVQVRREWTAWPTDWPTDRNVAYIESRNTNKKVQGQQWVKWTVPRNR